MAKEPTGKSLSPNPTAPKPRPTFRDRLTLGLILLAELLLPVMLSVGVIALLFAWQDFWATGDDLTLVFAAAVVMFAFILSMLFDRLLAPLRRRYHKRGVGFGKSAPARTFKKFLGGLLIPIGLAAAASQVVLSTPLGATTGIAYLKTVSTRLSPSAPPTEIAELALRSQDAPTKILAIQALGSLRTPEALTQLVRIADTDPRALRDGGSRYALRQAIASYGEMAIEPLLEFFRSLPAEDSLPGSLPDGVFERYFASGFAGLMEEARLSGVDEAGLAQIEASQAQLEASLAGLGMEQPAGGGADPQGRQDFVIQTLLAMDLREQADLLRFARATAADTAFSGQVRGDALLLLAQLGEQKDLDGLYAFLESEDPVLRMRALQAITAFQTRDDPGLEAGPQ